MKPIWLGAVMTGCILTAGLGGAEIWARLSPASRASRGLAERLPLAEPHALAADAALSRKDLVSARRETLAELRISPVRANAWLRLAQIDAAGGGRLGPEGIAALQHAYDAAPYDLSPGQARHRFAVQHASELPHDLHAQVEAEAAALSRQ